MRPCTIGLLITAGTRAVGGLAGAGAVASASLAAVSPSPVVAQPPSQSNALRQIVTGISLMIFACMGSGCGAAKPPLGRCDPRVVDKRVGREKDRNKSVQRAPAKRAKQWVLPS